LAAPANVLVFEVDVPRPGTYNINIACGDAFKAVTNQQVQVYDGTTFLRTLFTGRATSAANSYLDAQGNEFTAQQWPVLNVPVALIFQTTQVVFYIGDGVNATYIAAIEVQDAVQAQTNVGLRHGLKSLWRRRFITRQFRRKLLPLPIVPPLHNLVVARKRPTWKRRRFAPPRRKAYPIAPHFVVLSPPRRKPFTKRRPLRLLKHKVYIPVVAKLPLVLPWRKPPQPHIHRGWWGLRSRLYPSVGVVRIGGVAIPGSKVVVRIA
jgi:hypothetical protein